MITGIKTAVLSVALAGLISGMAQAQYYSGFGLGVSPYYGYGTYGYGGYGYGHSSTVDEGYFRGLGAYYQGLGQYNLANSIAAEHYESAYRQSLENRVKRAETRYELKRQREAYNEQHKRPSVTPEQISKSNEAKHPRRLTSRDYEPVLGSIFWPTALQGQGFETQRQQMQALFKERTSSNTGLGTRNCREIQALARTMRASLKSEINSLSADEYMLARKFLDSLAYEARFVEGVDGVAANP